MHPAQWWQIGRRGFANTFIAALIFINEKLALQINPFGSKNQLWCNNLRQKVSLRFIVLAVTKIINISGSCQSWRYHYGDGDSFCQCDDVALACDLCVIDNMRLGAKVLDGNMRFK